VRGAPGVTLPLHTPLPFVGWGVSSSSSSSPCCCCCLTCCCPTCTQHHRNNGQKAAARAAAGGADTSAGQHSRWVRLWRGEQFVTSSIPFSLPHPTPSQVSPLGLTPLLFPPCSDSMSTQPQTAPSHHNLAIPVPQHPPDHKPPANPITSLSPILPFTHPRNLSPKHQTPPTKTPQHFSKTP